mgnify:CR=1 FL=1
MYPTNQFVYSTEDFEIQGILSKELKEQWLTKHSKFAPIKEFETKARKVLHQVHLLVLRCHRQDTLRFRQLCQDVLDILQSQIVPQSHRILQDTLHQSHQMIFLMMNLSQVMNQVRIQMMVQNPLLGRHTHHQHHAHLPCQHTHLPHQPIHQPRRVHPNTQRFRTQIHQISLQLLHVKLNA